MFIWCRSFFSFSSQTSSLAKQSSVVNHGTPLTSFLLRCQASISSLVVGDTFSYRSWKPTQISLAQDSEALPHPASRRFSEQPGSSPEFLLGLGAVVVELFEDL